MGDNSFHIKNNRLRRFYENAEEVARYVDLSMVYPQQAVEALSKIADDKDFPLEEISDKEILSIGVFLYNVGNLFYHEGDSGESRTKLSEEIAGMDDSALKDFYRGILSREKGLGYDYDVIEDKENRKDIAEFIYQIINEDKYFIIEKVTGGAISLRPHEPVPPGALKPFRPCSEYAVRNSLLDYIYEKSEKPANEEERLRHAFENWVGFPPLEREDARYNNAGLPKRGAFKYFYDNLQ